MEDKYYKLYEELCEISRELEPYYDIDKVKGYSVYVWTKTNSNDEYDWGKNLFDIEEDEIVYYEDHEIIEDALPVIKRIQEKLKEIRLYTEELKNSFKR